MLSDTVLILKSFLIGESAMRPVFIILLCYFILCGSGCTRIPQPTTYAFTEQQKMQATHHWDVLANDVANQINTTLLRHNYVNTPVFVRVTCGTENTPCGSAETTQFNEAFRDLLITQLVRFNVPTNANEDKEAITVNYKVQVVYHRDARYAARPPGALTVLSSAISVLRHASIELQAIGAGILLDAASSATDTAGHYEIIITTSMITGNKFLFRTSDIYYINDLDFWHYQDTTTGASEIKITDH
jgi:hypothetical protein